MYLAPPSGRFRCMTSYLHIPHWLFWSQIVQLLSGKLNQHREFVHERSTVAINSGVVCYEVSDQNQLWKTAGPGKLTLSFRYKWCPNFNKWYCAVSSQTGQSELCVLCHRGTGCHILLDCLWSHTLQNCLNIHCPQWLQQRHFWTCGTIFP